jgi:hypothetical protein
MSFESSVLRIASIQSITRKSFRTSSAVNPRQRSSRSSAACQDGLESRRLRRVKPGAEAQEPIHNGKINFLDAGSCQLCAPTGASPAEAKERRYGHLPSRLYIHAQAPETPDYVATSESTRLFLIRLPLQAIVPVLLPSRAFIGPAPNIRTWVASTLAFRAWLASAQVFRTWLASAQGLPTVACFRSGLPRSACFRSGLPNLACFRPGLAPAEQATDSYQGYVG